MADGAWLAWLGAALWYGASGLRLIVAEPEDLRLNRMGMIRAFHQAITLMRASLRLLAWLGAGTVLVGTGVDVAVSSQATIVQLIEISAAGLAFIGLMFHVEHLAAQGRASSGARASLFTGIYILLSLLTLCLVSRDVAQLIAGPNRPWSALWIICAVGAALWGTALTSLALIRPVMDQDSPAMEVILAVVGSRWSVLIGMLIGGTLVGTLTGLVSLVQPQLFAFHWGTPTWRVPLLALAILLAVTLLSLLVLRLSALRQLWRSVLALPITGLPERALRVRVVRSRRWTVRVVNLAFAVLLLTLIAAVPLVVMAASLPLPNFAASTAVPGRPGAPTPRPTATLSGPANLSGQNDGVQVTITDTQFKTGPMVLHLTVTDDHGVPIPQAHLSLALSPEKSTTGGVIVDATSDPAGNTGRYTAPITFTQPDVWVVVAVVATADQSVLASVSFTLTVS